MNILIITTGGTIGSAFNGSSIDVVQNAGCPVAAHYAAEHPDVRFDIQSPLTILSERITADDFNTLANALFGIDHSAYDGVILTVGSDNLAYLSGFVGLLCGGWSVPLCLVAADRVLSDERSNGSVNFSCAVSLIRQKSRGAFVPYRNSSGVIYVHSATDIRQADLSDDFYSFNGVYGYFENDVLHVQRPYIQQRIPDVFDRRYQPCISDNVLLIHPYPLQDYSRLSTDGVKAVLHTLYHSATLDSSAAAPFIHSLKELPLFLASLRSDRKIYATTAESLAAGAIPLNDISPECAYVKLLLACAQDRLSVREFMEVKG